MELFNELPLTEVILTAAQNFYSKLNLLGSSIETLELQQVLIDQVWQNLSVDLVMTILGNNRSIIKYVEENAILNGYKKFQVLSLSLQLEYLNFQLEAFLGENSDPKNVISNVSKINKMNLDVSFDYYVNDIKEEIENLEDASDLFILRIHTLRGLLSHLEVENIDFYEQQISEFQQFLDSSLQSNEENFSFETFVSYKKLLFSIYNSLQAIIQNPLAKALVMHDFNNIIHGDFNKLTLDLRLFLAQKYQLMSKETQNLSFQELLRLNKDFISIIGRMIDLLYIFERMELNRELTPNQYNYSILNTLGKVKSTSTSSASDSASLVYYGMLSSRKTVNFEFNYEGMEEIEKVYTFKLVRKLGWLIRTILQNMCKFDASNIKLDFKVEGNNFYVLIYDDIQNEGLEDTVDYINNKIKEKPEIDKHGNVHQTGGLKLGGNMIGESFDGEVTCEPVVGDFAKVFKIKIPINRILNG
ncbi:MAG: hypothetical protein ABIM99_04820 [Candidatus Dojkabacteria bacterium]